MIVEKFIPVEFAANNYLIYDEKSKEAVLIDCAGSNEAILKRIDELGLELKYILLTHAHFDHVLGLLEFKQKFPDVKIALSKEDKVLYENMKTQCMMFGQQSLKTPQIDLLIDENVSFNLNGDKVAVITTPGHSKGSVCYLINDNLFSGDTLFFEEIGRCDLPGGSFKEIEASIKNKLFKLDDDIKVFTGHGDNTSIGHEKIHNAYFGEKALY